MDPNANLDEQLELVKEIKALQESDEPLERFADRLDTKAARLIDLIESLDHWITGGGALPQRWERADDGK